VSGWRRTWTCWWLAGLAVAVLGGACARKQAPVARPTGPPPGEVAVGDTLGRRPPAPPEPISEPAVAEPEPVVEESPALDARSLDELNRDSPLQPLFFDFDSAEVSAAGQAVLDANAEILKRHPTWVVTIEGHCDERGTAEYNLALGERRAIAARNYLVTLGVPASSLRTVSYGEEFPFEPGHTEEAYARNRRAHFVITSK
jgi:peptidoglycan-associated lipoprotein